MHALAMLEMDTPHWVIAEMPPGYQTRMAEIRRLSDELQDMSRFARLLWSIGPDLSEAVRDTFAALKFETDWLDMDPPQAVVVRVDGPRRLLFHMSASDGLIDKKSVEVEHAFRLVHQVAGDRDRVVLVANGDRMHPPSERSDLVAPDALRLLQRMGVNCVSAPTLFRVWSLASHNPDRMRKAVGQLYEQDGGIFGLGA